MVPFKRIINRMGKKSVSRKWYGQYGDHVGADCRVALTPDKQSAQTELARLLQATQTSQEVLRQSGTDQCSTPIGATPS